jgi:hypothetical protein
VGGKEIRIDGERLLERREGLAVPLCHNKNPRERVCIGRKAGPFRGPFDLGNGLFVPQRLGKVSLNWCAMA